MFTFLCSIWSIVICLFVLSLVAIVLYYLSLELRLLITSLVLSNLSLKIRHLHRLMTINYQKFVVVCVLLVLYVQGNIRVRVTVFNATFNNILFIS